MLERVKYVNHINETLDIDSSELFVQGTDLRDYSWSISSKNDKISGFKRGVTSKSVTIVIKGGTESECFNICNSLFSIMEKDVLAAKPGKLFVGSYYLKCFITESKKAEYQRTQGYLKVTVKAVTEEPYWIRESVTCFGYEITNREGENLDYNREFPYDYTSNVLGTQLNNTGFVESNFRLVIYGVCENPRITIAGHVYGADVSIAANEYLTIDSTNKTVILTHADGKTENCFGRRTKEQRVFDKMPAGLSNVSASGDFKFDIVLLDERSEPKWT